MTDIAKAMLDEYQIRKTKKQKTRFIEYATQFAKERGYDCTVEKGYMGARNILIGSPDTADVIYTAHYDTCPVLPFPNFITPKKISLYLLYQLLIVAVAMAVMLGAMIGLVHLIDVASAAWNITNEWVLFALTEAAVFVVAALMLTLMLAGPANQHTANDNTSGVVTLLTVMDSLPVSDRSHVAFVFFDLEETGLFGSAGFAAKHRSQLKGTLLVNFDCVSDGKHILLAVGKGAESFIPALKESFSARDGFEVDVRSKGVFYPSDQMNFTHGVGVASLKYSKWLKTDYMDRIHTGRDVIFEEENIQYLTECALCLAEKFRRVKA